MLLLKAEITSDPLARGYAGMTDVQVAASLNTKNRTRTRTVVTIIELMQSLVYTEYIALTAAQRQYLDLLVASEVLNINTGNIKDGLAAIFIGGTTTRTNLLALVSETISRAAELGWDEIKVGWVGMAKVAQ